MGKRKLPFLRMLGAVRAETVGVGMTVGMTMAVIWKCFGNSTSKIHERKKFLSYHVIYKIRLIRFGLGIFNKPPRFCFPTPPYHEAFLWGGLLNN